MKKRDNSIDILRGIAILIMFGANVLGYVTPCSRHPMWFAIASSMAAPLFIMISGYMAAQNAASKSRGASYYLIRGGMLILTGVLIDAMIWRILPFASFDVLYLIGLSLPAVYLLRKASDWIKCVAVAATLAATFLLQQAWPYAENPVEIEYLLPGADFSAYTPANFIKGMLYDGWFPVFPWIGAAIAGSIFASVRSRMYRGFADMKVAATGAVTAIAGIAGVYLFYSSEAPFDMLASREPYGEIFYPSTPLFMIGGLGACILAMAIADATQELKVWKPVMVLGRASLFNYIVHIAIINFAISPLFEDNEQPLSTGWIVYAALAASCLALSWGVSVMKSRVKSDNFFYKFYFGG
ncbi:MAG: DUF1624 domain-containing protein [Tannerellaceae bacterium]|jgi:uncharacterized membrane protein|nr:DUF1624 domain-containing protein [Tannerellaceae bacterium]